MSFPGLKFSRRDEVALVLSTFGPAAVIMARDRDPSVLPGWWGGLLLLLILGAATGLASTAWVRWLYGACAACLLVVAVYAGVIEAFRQ